ncbi:MAG TPA: hypothetical protein PKN95_09535 [Verrucomicrobiota bacterium]|nr:hypothetical protein [Verrucomicrobiota bacterium]HNT15755.1 hypothetical protein [Verrucomicrobiota bacterium]
MIEKINKMTPGKPVQRIRFLIPPVRDYQFAAEASGKLTELAIGAPGRATGGLLRGVIGGGFPDVEFHVRDPSLEFTRGLAPSAGTGNLP